MNLLPVGEARARMLAAIAPLEPEIAALADAVGRVLARDVVAARPQPPFDASAMDGWAVRSADTPGRLTVIGESAAGHGFPGPVGPGQAVRIFTGAAVPTGCDAVVIQEDAAATEGAVRVPAVPKGRHVRPTGGDFGKGERLLAAGVVIDPWRLSLAAAAGCADLAVGPRPVITVLATGEEVVEAPAAPGPWQIYDSGSHALAALVAGWGGRPRRLRPVRDDLEATIGALRAAEGDLVVTLGGASVGDHDLVRTAAQALGLDLRVASVAVRPGKPTFFGVLGDGRPLLGLPGNPASAMVCAELFLRPLVRAFQGAPAAPSTVAAVLADPLPSNGPREHWMRASLIPEAGVLRVRPHRDQDSSLVRVFAAADALLLRPAGAAAAQAGDLAEVLPLARL